SDVDASDLCQQNAQVSLLDFELPNGRGDLRRREDRRRHLVEQWLKYVMIAAVDQDDIEISVSQRPTPDSPGKPPPATHHALSLSVVSLDNRFGLVRPGFSQHRTHGSPRLRSLSLTASASCTQCSSHPGSLRHPGAPESRYLAMRGLAWCRDCTERIWLQRD